MKTYKAIQHFYGDFTANIGPFQGGYHDYPKYNENITIETSKGLIEIKVKNIQFLGMYLDCGESPHYIKVSGPVQMTHHKWEDIRAKYEKDPEAAGRIQEIRNQIETEIKLFRNGYEAAIEDVTLFIETEISEHTTFTVQYLLDTIKGFKP